MTQEGLADQDVVDWAEGPERSALTAELRRRLELHPFYKKTLMLGAFPILSSEKVSDYALLEAGYLIHHMLDGRQDILNAMARNRIRFSIMACDEFTTQVPEHSKMTPAEFWDRRARGLGSSRTDPVASCAEENLLCYPGDPYNTENIMIHEFAHAIHLNGIYDVDTTFDKRLGKTYKAAMAKGLWKSKYAANNKAEYWAEGVQSWFNTNRPPDHDHNHVDTREELKEYDPGLAKLVGEIFGDTGWRYKRPSQRKSPGHLQGFDPGAFDYVVVDEFHHAAAATYRRVIEHFEPAFLLGLTATPERMDGGDLLALCGENLVHRCDMWDAIARGRLCPFTYHGLPDAIDYTQIPWRGRRFDEAALTAAAATRATSPPRRR